MVSLVWAWKFIGNQANDGIQTTPVKVSNLSNTVSIVGRGEDGDLHIDNSGYPPRSGLVQSSLSDPKQIW